ncbi:caspase domain-containing protein [Hygrophoropsis aurantiaca]|uniref:Caspase domain-containing protein n=1 Tax=Hygrophoropsis aurantiaca TaxID=72124 RepID=A0ACB8AK42_9AGAM|nr:caspase domain-containing protein [Hygrophoropsis aurantiaca]
MAIEGPIHRTCSQGRKKALLIGIGYKLRRIESLQKLPAVHSDAKLLKTFLINTYGYAEEDVVLMLDERESQHRLIPTRKNVLHQIDLLVKHARDGDQFFFYYAGHGHQEVCQDHTEIDGQDELMDTCDGEKIMDNDLRRRLIEPLPSGTKLFALIDACHSETMLDLDKEICEDCLTATAIKQKKLKQLWLSDARRSSLSHRENKQSREPKHWESHFHKSTSKTKLQPKRLNSHVSRSRPNPLRRTDLIEWDTPISATCKCHTGARRIDHKAHVISLSACRDDESAFDDLSTGGTMTKTLEENPHPCLAHLCDGVRIRVNELNRRRLGSFVKEPSTATPVNLTGNDPDAVWPQHPSYGSLYNLNLEEMFDP